MSVHPLPPPAPAQQAPAFGAATLSEIFGAAPLDGAATGFLAAVLPPGGTILWAQDRLSRREIGAPCLAGLGRAMLRVDLSRPADVLSAIEDALSCPAIAVVVGEIWGAPAVLDFTATRRLAMRAEAAGRPCWLLRHAAAPIASAARQRFRVAALPSDRAQDDPAAPGDPCWRVELFRSRLSPPGLWAVRHDRAQDRLHFAALSSDRTLAEPSATHGRAGIG